MDHIWIAFLVSHDLMLRRSWPIAAYRSETDARAAVPMLEAQIQAVRRTAQARVAFLKAWEADHPRPPEALLPVPGNPYRSRRQAPETMTAHARAADAAWRAARDAALAEAGLSLDPSIPQPLHLAEHLLDLRIEISSLPLHS
jgi:hypothetical protein